jgi:hypothetical protein
LGWVVHQHEFKNPFDGTIIKRDRVYIPSRLNENRFLGREYVANLMMSGNENLVKAWLDGDWSIIDGAFFDCWDPKRHIVRPFEIRRTGDPLQIRRLGFGQAVLVWLVGSSRQTITRRKRGFGCRVVASFGIANGMECRTGSQTSASRCTPNSLAPALRSGKVLTPR